MEVVNKLLRRLIFLDIDGTLVSFQTHQIPESTLSALAEAKRRGHKLFICTGRPRQWVFTSAIEPAIPLLDGIITVNGAQSFVGNSEASCLPMSQRDVELLLEDATRYNYPCVVVGEKDVAVYNANPMVEKLFRDFIQVDDVDFSLPVEQILGRQRVLQLSPFFTAEQQERIIPHLSEVFCTRWHPAFADVIHIGANKGNAIADVAAHLGASLADTIAFGDGENDNSMLERAGVGVAMGNATPGTKAAADFVTRSVDEGGIAHALRHLGVIDV